MRIVSDFRDWYDHAFDTAGPVFERLSTGGMERPEMMQFLATAGFCVPRYGVVNNLVPLLLGQRPVAIQKDGKQHLLFPFVVVHTDTTAHRGDGKLVVSAQQALGEYPDAFCVEYIPSIVNGTSISYRWLQVGSRTWWLRYWSETDWRSNVGEGGVEIISSGRSRPNNPHLTSSMFGIDFVSVGRLYAIDYNIAPGLAPLNGHIKASEIVKELSSNSAQSPHSGPTGQRQ